MLGLILCSCLAGTVSAGNITLDTYATCVMMEQGVIVKINTTNKGDEAAVNLKFSLKFQGVIKSSGVFSRLDPGRSIDAMVFFKPGVAKPGSYPVEVLVEFQDLAGSPFSNLSHASFIHLEGVNTEVFISPAELDLDHAGRLRLKIINTGAANHRIRVRLAAPKEFSVSPVERTMEIKGRDKGRAVFTLNNLTARPGAVYSVLAFMEYEADGRHFSLVTESVVRIIEKENFFKRRQRSVFLMGAALMALVLLAQGYSRKRKGRKHGRG